MTTPEEVLQRYWGHLSFRTQQKEVIQSVLLKKDTLALMPTGGGKSICFQVPALLMEGICLVVTPLIALMKDQISHLKNKHIPALGVYSGMTYREIDTVLDRCVYDNIKFLYLSPERLKTDIFRERLRKMKVSLIAVDEAHCISQWGYDFRPSYLEIAAVRLIATRAPVIALTATATPEVVKDIQEKLLFKTPNIFKKSFARSNISYACLEEENKEEKLLHIIKRVTGSTIVYVRSRLRAQKVSNLLNANKINAAFYHAGLSHEVRNKTQSLWMKGQVPVIVATNAFGMGIDKSNVRLVVHLDVPETLEAYYQEAGRAGRDERKAYAVLLFSQADFIDLRDKLELNYPELPIIKRVYQCIANYLKIAVGSSEMASFDFDIDLFVQTYNLKKKEVHIVLNILEKEEILQLNSSYYEPSKIFFLIKDQELYEYQVSNPAHDWFIKSILRIYGGEVFSNFISISERFLSATLKIPNKEVEKKLSYLASANVIMYSKQCEKPQLTFLTARQDAANLSINIRNINGRKNKEKEKLETVIQYTSQLNICRSVLLSRYFGEETTTNCNVCDVCIEKRKRLLEEEKILREIVLGELKASPTTTEEIVRKHKLKDSYTVIHIIRKLLDNDLLRKDEQGILSLK